MIRLAILPITITNLEMLNYPCIRFKIYIISLHFQMPGAKFCSAFHLNNFDGLIKFSSSIFSYQIKPTKPGIGRLLSNILVLVKVIG